MELHIIDPTLQGMALIIIGPLGPGEIGRIYHMREDELGEVSDRYVAYHGANWPEMSRAYAGNNWQMARRFALTGRFHDR